MYTDTVLFSVFRVRLITWNVGNSPPPKDLSELLGLQGKNLPNVYAIGSVPQIIHTEMLDIQIYSTD